MNTLVPSPYHQSRTDPDSPDADVLRTRLLAAVPDDHPDADTAETLVVDRRAELRPAQMGEMKLRDLLRGKALPISHIRTVDSLRKRS